MSEISPALVRRWAVDLKAQGLAPKTRRHILGALRTLCTWYEVEEEGSFRAPSFAPALRTIERTSRAKPLVYTLAEQTQVFAELPEEDRGVFLALARFALRPGEARAVLAEDRDPKRREITVWRAMDGKGSRIEPRDSTKT